jgi:response regulator RpfG family c-di-GMP phosphodiesterase
MENKSTLIFVVEDDLPCGMLIKYYLAKKYYTNVYLFSTEKECLANLSKKPDIIITDYRLKSMNGIDLIRKIKRIYPSFYSILLTALPADEIFNKSMNNRLIDKYIRKSLTSMSELFYSIEEYLEPVYVKRNQI